MAPLVDKNTLYHGETVPPLVMAAVERAREAGFPYSCAPNQGRLLAVLAAGRNGGLIGETGCGYGAGLAWMVTATDATTRFVSVERDGARAAASRALFADHPNVTVLHGDWRQIHDHAPFDLLFLDGGGSGKGAGDAPADPGRLLVPGGTVVMDDFHPPADGWPLSAPTPVDGEGRDIDAARRYWFEHSDLLTTECRVHPIASALIGMRRGR